MGSRWNAASGASGYPTGSAIKRKYHTEKWHKRRRKYHTEKWRKIKWKYHSEKWHVEQAQWGHHGKKEKYMKRKDRLIEAATETQRPNSKTRV